MYLISSLAGASGKAGDIRNTDLILEFQENSLEEGLATIPVLLPGGNPHGERKVWWATVHGFA